MAKVVNSLESIKKHLKTFHVEVTDRQIAAAVAEAMENNIPIYGSGSFLNRKHPAHPDYWTQERING
jgi:hypothetical protein